MQWLHEQRKDGLGYTQEEFARLVGCSVITIRKIEHSVLRPLLQRNPYKGLRPFYEAGADDFFGREALTARLLARLR